jgi:hypothetical protein
LSFRPYTSDMVATGEADGDCRCGDFQPSVKSSMRSWLHDLTELRLSNATVRRSTSRRPLLPHDARLLTVASSPDGKWIASDWRTIVRAFGSFQAVGRSPRSGAQSAVGRARSISAPEAGEAAGTRQPTWATGTPIGRAGTLASSREQAQVPRRRGRLRVVQGSGEGRVELPAVDRRFCR